MGLTTKKTDGNVIIIPATADTVTGDVIEFSTHGIGIAQVTALSGADISVDTRGVYELPADETEAFVIGDLVNWDNVSSTCLSTGDVVAGMIVVGKAGTTAGTVWVKIG